MRSEDSIRLIAAATALFGVVAFLVRWDGLDERAQLAIPVAGFVLFAWGGTLAIGWPEPFLAMLPLPFVFVGMTQRPGTASAVSPLAALALVVAARFRFDSILLTTLVLALPMLVFVGEALSFAQNRRCRTLRCCSRLSIGHPSHERPQM